GLVARRVDDDVGVGERRQPFFAAQQAGEDRGALDAQLPRAPAQRGADAAVVARDHQPRPGQRRAREGLDQHVDALARRQHAEIEHHRRRAQPPARAEGTGRWRRRQLVEVERVRQQPHLRRRHTHREQLPALGLAHRRHQRRLRQHGAAEGVVEQPLRGQPSFDARRRAVGRQHVRHAGARQRAGGDRSRQVVAAVQVSDVDRGRDTAQPGAEPARHEPLQPVGGAVGDVAEDVHLDARIGRARRGRREPRLGVARVGGGDEHAVPALRQPARQRGDDAGDAAVGPRLPVVGRDVQHAQRCHGGSIVPPAPWWPLRNARPRALGVAGRVAPIMAKRRRGRPRAAARRSAPAAAPPRASRRDWGRREWTNLGWALLPPLLAVAVYFEAIGNPFVYDDLETVVRNPSLRDLSNWVFVLVFSPFRPVVNVSYAVDAAIWGLDPFGFHLTGVLLHALNVALFYLFARALLRDRDAMVENDASPAPR